MFPRLLSLAVELRMKYVKSNASPCVLNCLDNSIPRHKVVQAGINVTQTQFFFHPGAELWTFRGISMKIGGVVPGVGSAAAIVQLKKAFDLIINDSRNFLYF